MLLDYAMPAGLYSAFWDLLCRINAFYNVDIFADVLFSATSLHHTTIVYMLLDYTLLIN